MNFDGIEFECKQHGIDYRIACEDCNEKWAKFEKVMIDMAENNNSDEIKRDDK